MIREIWLNNGMPALVDELDWFRLFPGNRWCAQINDSGAVYAYRKIIDPSSGFRVKQWLHRAVMNAPPGTVVDHKDNDSLNCRRCNLRITDFTQNGHNYIRVTSNPYRGITRRAEGWCAQIQFEGQKIWLGCDLDAKVAARLYDEAARRLYGQHAVLNFPGDTWLTSK